ncbi:MAG: DNA-3-methyladenine glycosylase I [Gammaproteobacteria bacterium]|nr:DNA-3-methyladenine glycosylase I [Gammaproteobacteria bacterium]MCP5196416.1 DNA-3-methyladenine glycosylase I [Gammaproteobacteria bacterium]
MQTRCAWCMTDLLYQAYHDHEWGVPAHDDRRLFEMLILEGAQAGLNWLTILRKREHYRRAFAGFDPACIAGYGQEQIARLLADPGIVRNRRKVEAAIKNARAFLAVQEQHGTFDTFLWCYVDGRPLQNTWRSLAEIPAYTPKAERISRDLKQLGFAFVGPTICYAFMQAVGMVNDHTIDCFRHQELQESADYPSNPGMVSAVTGSPNRSG